ncbi:MAG: histidine kinase [Bacteroidota bacterium]
MNRGGLAKFFNEVRKKINLWLFQAQKRVIELNGRFVEPESLVVDISCPREGIWIDLVMNEFGINKKRVGLQMLFWGVIWVSLPVIGWAWMGGNETMFFRNSLVLSVTSATIAGINVGYLIPKFLFPKKYIQYILLSFLLLTFISVLSHEFWINVFEMSDMPFRNRPPHKGSFLPRGKFFKYFPYVGRAVPLLICLIGSALYEMATFAHIQSQRALNLQHEKLDAEMKFLKSQINPHFLFNALNNIYSLSILKSENTSDNLLKLSDMLRYVLYECNAEQVPLQKEVEYIRNLIGLNMLKDSQGLNVKTSLSEISPHLMITPLLFVPFIENAFKHSKIEQLDKGWIRLHLEEEKGRIHFSLSNSMPREAISKDGQGGIGLVNVKRRLELYYPQRHQLDILESEDEFRVQLEIDLA